MHLHIHYTRWIIDLCGSTLPLFLCIVSHAMSHYGSFHTVHFYTNFSMLPRVRMQNQNLIHRSNLRKYGNGMI
jgi:hypothetical protein